MKSYKTLIETVPDFPKPGVDFKNINPIFKSVDATNQLVSDLSEGLEGQVDVVACLDARGFILGPLVAQAVSVGFVLMRKPGKLAGRVLSEPYDKEYGVDTLEVEVNSLRPGERVLIVDDVIATGGTVLAAARLSEQLTGNKPVGVRAVVDIPALGGSELVAASGINVKTLVH